MTRSAPVAGVVVEGRAHFLTKASHPRRSLTVGTPNYTLNSSLCDIMKTQATIQDIHFICATALVSLPTAPKYLRNGEPMRPAMIQRIEGALRQLRLERLLRRPQEGRGELAS